MKVRSPDGDTEYFDIFAGVLKRDTLAPYLFIICLDYVLRHRLIKSKKMTSSWQRKEVEGTPQKAITDTDYADDIAILANNTQPSRNTTA